MIDICNSSSGIYQIKNIITDKTYIGSAVNLKHRMAVHKSHLKLNKHGNSYLQNAFNKYGEDNFISEILFTCPKEELLRLEQYHIDNYKPEYNILKVAGSTLGFKHSDEFKKKISERMKGNQLHKLVKNRPVKKEKVLKPQRFLYQIDKDTFEIITTYKSIKEYTKKTGFNGGTVSSVLQGKCFTAHGFTWSWNDLFDVKLLQQQKDKYTRPLYEVILLTLDGNFVKEYPSLVSVSLDLSVSSSNVSYCCQGQRQQIKGYIMMYKKDYCENNVKERVDMIGKFNHKRKENRNG